MFVQEFEKVARKATRWSDKSDEFVNDRSSELKSDPAFKKAKELRGVNTSAKDDPSRYRKALYDYEQRKGYE